MKEKDITLHISNKTIINTILSLLLLYFLYYMRDLVILLLMSIVIASSVEPLAVRFKKHKIPRTLTVFSAFTMAIGFFMIVIYLFIPIVATEVAKFLNHLPEMVKSLTSFLGEDEFSSSVVKYLIGNPEGLTLQNVLPGLKDAATGIGGGIAQTAGSFLQTIMKIFLVTVISFYLAVQENCIEDFLSVLTPKKNEKYIIDLWVRSQDKIAKWAQGQLILGLIIGIMVYIGLSLIGVPYALLLALLAGLFELIPVIGPVLSMIPAALLGLSAGGIGMFLAVLVFYIVVQRLENDLIYPMVVNKLTGVNSLVIIIALLVGVQLAGIWGVLLSVPVASALMEYINDVRKNKGLV